MSHTKPCETSFCGYAALVTEIKLIRGIRQIKTSVENGSMHYSSYQNPDSSLQISCLPFFLHCGEAVAAVNRSVAGRLEGYSCFLAASCASGGEVLSLRSLSVLSCIAASLAALRLVLEAFGCIEFLFFGREDEFIFAIFTNECLVFVHLSFPRFE